jgi:hypothetical protein
MPNLAEARVQNLWRFGVFHSVEGVSDDGGKPHAAVQNTTLSTTCYT